MQLYGRTFHAVSKLMAIALMIYYEEPLFLLYIFSSFFDFLIVKRLNWRKCLSKSFPKYYNLNCIFCGKRIFIVCSRVLVKKLFLDIVFANFFQTFTDCNIFVNAINGKHDLMQFSWRFLLKLLVHVNFLLCSYQYTSEGVFSPNLLWKSH